MQELTAGVNWYAVCSGGVAAFLVGWLWYSPVGFGRKWAAGVGVDLTKSPPLDAMIAQIIGLFLMSWFVGVTAVSQALLTVILATLAAIALAFSARGFSGHKMAARLIDAGFTLVALIIMILAQGIGMSITG